ncbi:hypothetical protein ZEAMMB73_Zm00001d034157 [Zea mays]|uniref:Uncharacterized protein n=1 Tax=Zea mays TaxID=4577 RepID=A0A1D6L5U2_MAIZE|nr:hypothetical protein ZEAMMB73_Zm00001d034157 [Zea mays]ONM09659.1 hypothetical protein ZEAMMB73_Zm00001d034157 [Zea mays]ONM09662.1 hypothetical protein ZEAMMB73_Zm00001d034157 [Zea mays]ONM09665.1 hypothetical protein ZEAMMB73_Zm00001d034157 [Zea mays]ONM09668.1 hypothetical protein ZEAMMB73_Zm00001d034157 [Zea mays]
MDQVLQTILQILDTFMALSEDTHGEIILYLRIPLIFAQLMVVSCSGFDNSSLLNDFRKLYQLMCGGPGQGVVVALVRYPRRQAAYSKIPPPRTPLRGGHGH